MDVLDAGVVEDDFVAEQDAPTHADSFRAELVADGVVAEIEDGEGDGEGGESGEGAQEIVSEQAFGGPGEGGEGGGTGTMPALCLNILPELGGAGLVRIESSAESPSPGAGPGWLPACWIRTGSPQRRHTLSHWIKLPWHNVNFKLKSASFCS